jgi:hypothetical protein
LPGSKIRGINDDPLRFDTGYGPGPFKRKAAGEILPPPDRFTDQDLMKKEVGSIFRY